MVNRLRGMKDLIFEESQKFLYIVNIASSVAKNYGYYYIETPILEETKLFRRSVGESSDIVGKEMYQFTDKGGNDISMRPEGTASVVRAYVQAKLDRGQNQKFKFFYYGPMFRYERPQKGRLREFHQFGCESFCEPSVYEDYTVIEMIATIFDKLNIGYILEINSLGSQECRPSYREKLLSFLDTKKDNLCEDCNRRIKTNPIRVLDCKNLNCQEELSKAPKITDNLCQSCQSDFEKLKDLLEQNKIEYSVNKNLVRGLDYYSKTAFEFVSKEIGAQSAIAGGGRYDSLVEFLGGKPIPAIGFAIGIERIMSLVQLPKQENEGFYFGAMDKDAVDKVINIAKDIKKSNKVYVEFASKKLKAHLKGADKQNARFCVVIGENELNSGTIWVKDLVIKEENTIRIEEFLKKYS